MRTALAALLLYLIVACQTLGLAPARSLDDRLAYAYGVHTAVVEVIASAAQTGKLSPPEARQAANLAENSRQLLDGARAIEQIDPKGSNAKLNLATTVLDQLQTYLKSRGETGR